MINKINNRIENLAFSFISYKGVSIFSDRDVLVVIGKEERCQGQGDDEADKA